MKKIILILLGIVLFLSGCIQKESVITYEQVKVVSSYECQTHNGFATFHYSCLTLSDGRVGYSNFFGIETNSTITLERVDGRDGVYDDALGRNYLNIKNINP